MTQQNPKTAQEPPLWQYVRPDAYVRPAEPTAETVRKGLLGLWDRLRGRAAEALVEHAALSDLDPQTLDRVAPAPDWAAPAAALDDALADWLADDAPPSSMRAVVGAPGSGTARVLTRWAHRHGWRVLEAPTPEQILHPDDDAWIDRLSDDPETPLVIPRLAHCYLRHHDGLALLRRLLDLLWEGRRRCLVGCDAWAWAYLRNAAQLDALLPPPLMLQAFDAQRLRRWLHALAQRGDGAERVFRQAADGAFVLPPRPAADDEAPAEPAAYLRHLAGYSHGLPGVAWAIWRGSLRDTPEEAAEAEADEAAHTTWVKPWADLNLPAIPDAGSRSLLYVLHALLLHDGLPAPLLATLLPLPPGEGIRSLHQLKTARLIEATAGRWRVTPTGYPAAHRFIKQEGYLTPAL